MRCVGLVLLAGCVPPGPVEVWGSDPLAWTPGTEAEDPLADHRPDDAACPDAAWQIEGQVLEVQSGACRHGWFVQEAGSLRAGDVLEVELWHTGLDAAEEAQAHAALVLGGEVLWEAFVDIPDDPRVWSLTLDLPSDVPEGELLGLHLHNHGDNVWKLGPVLVRR